MSGGFLDSVTSTLSDWGTSISQGASSAWQKTKDATSSLTGSTPSTTSSYIPTTTTAPMTTGGRHRRSRRRHMKGGFQDNTPTGLAANAASFSGQTAQPHNWVGGRTRRRRRKRRCNKSCRRRR